MRDSSRYFDASERIFAEQLRDRDACRLMGWLYAGDGADPDDLDRDLTADLCLACGRFRTAELHDPCIANLPGVQFACCGHGSSGRRVSVTGWFGHLEGPAAAHKMRELGGNPPAPAFLLDPIGRATRTALHLAEDVEELVATHGERVPRYCLVCGAAEQDVGPTTPGPSVCPLTEDDIGNFWEPTWQELNCLDGRLNDVWKAEPEA
jgi:hypothetical protein